MYKRITTLLIVCSSICMFSCKNIYYVNQSASNLKWKPEYDVKYVIDADSTTKSTISYTNENSKQTKVKATSGSWDKTVSIKNNKKIKYVVNITNENHTPTTVKLIIDDKFAKEFKSTSKKHKIVYKIRTF